MIIIRLPIFHLARYFDHRGNFSLLCRISTLPSSGGPMAHPRHNKGKGKGEGRKNKNGGNIISKPL
jgi:hypothetical protein